MSFAKYSGRISILTIDCNIRALKNPYTRVDAYGLLLKDRRLFSQCLGQILIERVHEALGVEPWLIWADKHGEILGHLAAFDG